MRAYELLAGAVLVWRAVAHGPEKIGRGWTEHHYNKNSGGRREWTRVMRVAAGMNIIWTKLGRVAIRSPDAAATAAGKKSQNSSPTSTTAHFTPTPRW